MPWRIAPSRFAFALAACSVVAVAPAAAEECRFAPMEQINLDTGVEPLLQIDGECTDPDYNEQTFVIDKTENLTFQVPDGPLIPYTEVTGHFPATNTRETLPDGINQSPTTFRQNYVFRFPAEEYWQNRSFEQQHPTGGGTVDNRMAFTNGAFSVNWMSASMPNHVASHRHQAAATQVAKAYANKLYGNTEKIYSYHWGCSGGGIVSMAAAENTTGVWDGVQPQCMGPSGTATYHSFHWQAHYAMAISKEKRDAIAAAAAPGGSGDIYAGLNEEEKAVLEEFLSAGYPLAIIGSHFEGVDLPLVDPVDIRVTDPTYEDDFWSKPGYAGANPPDYLKAAKIDGWATITGITRDDQGKPTAIQFDPATVPELGSIGDAYLEFWVYAPDGKTRLVDPQRAAGHFTQNKRRFSLQGKFDHAKGRLEMTGSFPQRWGPDVPIVNSPVLLDALEVGSKVRINNRFLLAMYYYPRHSIIAGARSYDQYRNDDGSPKYPQRSNTSLLDHANYRTMGGRIESGNIKTKVMVMEGMADNLSWPLFNASYAEQIQRALGPEKARDMMRFYLHENGRHAAGAGEWGIFQQSMQDLMAWVEDGVAPPPSTQYTIENGQVVLPDSAAERHGLQPVMSLLVNGGQRVEVGVEEPVALSANLAMPPETGMIVKYNWTIAGADDARAAKENLAETGGVDQYLWSFADAEEASTALDKPQKQVSVNRKVSFSEPGEYIVRLTVHGQRDGLLNPDDQSLLRNFRDVRVIVKE